MHEQCEFFLTNMTDASATQFDSSVDFPQFDSCGSCLKLFSIRLASVKSFISLLTIGGAAVTFRA